MKSLKIGHQSEGYLWLAEDGMAPHTILFLGLKKL